MRLIPLLPSDWQGWAMQISSDYIFQVGDYYDQAGDFLGFISQIQYFFTVWGAAPRGPYILPGAFVQVGVPPFAGVPQELLEPVPQDSDPESVVIHPDPSPPAPIFGRRGRHDDEAGPSRPRVRREFPSPLPAPYEPLTRPSVLAGEAEFAAAMASIDRVLADAMEFLGESKTPVKDEEDSVQYGMIGTYHLEPIPPPAPEPHPTTTQITIREDPSRQVVDELFRSTQIALEADEGRGESLLPDEDAPEDPLDYFMEDDEEEDPEEEADSGASTQESAA